MIITNENAHKVAMAMLFGHLSNSAVGMNQDQRSQCELLGIADDGSFIAYSYNTEEHPRETSELGACHYLTESGDWETIEDSDGESDDEGNVYTSDYYNGVITSTFGLSRLHVGVNMGEWSDESCDASADGMFYIFKDEASFIDAEHRINSVRIIPLENGGKFEVDLSINPSVAHLEESNQVSEKIRTLLGKLSISEALCINAWDGKKNFPKILEVTGLDFSPYAPKENLNKSFVQVVAETFGGAYISSNYEAIEAIKETSPSIQPVSKDDHIHNEIILIERVKGDLSKLSDVVGDKSIFKDLSIDVSSIFSNEQTIAHIIARYSRNIELISDAFNKLNEFGINPSFVDKDGNTPLHILCKYNDYLDANYFSIIEKNNLDLSVSNFENKTAIDILEERIQNFNIDSNNFAFTKKSYENLLTMMKSQARSDEAMSNLSEVIPKEQARTTKNNI